MLNLEKGGFYIYKIEKNLYHKINVISEKNLDIYLLKENLNIIYHKRDKNFYTEIIPKENMFLYIFNNNTFSKIYIEDNIYKRIELRYVGILSFVLAMLTFILRKRGYVK